MDPARPPPSLLTADEIAFYHREGYLKIENAVSTSQLAKMLQLTQELIDASRGITESTSVFELDEGHSSESPRLTRIKEIVDVSPYFLEVLRDSKLTGVLRDLLGEDVVLGTTKLNVKAPLDVKTNVGGRQVEWHQDWAFYPATNDSLLTIGLMLHDVTSENSPLQIIPGSHLGPVLSHHSKEYGYFAGAIDPADPLFHKEKAVSLTGKAGTITVHHVRLLHGSSANKSDKSRWMCFFECAAADAWPLCGGSCFSNKGQGELWDMVGRRMVIGKPTLCPRVKECPIRLCLPPAPIGGSIFKTQRSGGAKSAFD